MDKKRLPAQFFETYTGNLPVKEWLLSLDPKDCKAIGNDIRTAEFGWPVGMPLCRPLKGYKGLWEIRTSLSNGRIARVLFCAHDGAMTLLHGFIKKSQKTPVRDLHLADKRMRSLK